MTAKITICIPTYNRAPMLRHLLAELNRQAEVLPKSLFCIYVSDNASSDETNSVLRSYDGIIPLNYDTQPNNIGAYNNIQACYSFPKTEYLVYCADDDLIDLKIVMRVMILMDSNGSLGAVYCPWMLESGSSGKRMLSHFPTIPTTLFKKGDLGVALNTILGNNLFPEIAIFRTQACSNLPPHTTVAFWFFILFPKLLVDWDVVIADKSFAFYTSYLDHPVGPRVESQAGNMEVASAWDTYRGGMEVFTRSALHRAGMTRSDIVGATLKINEFVANRQVVAMRAQCKRGNYVDALYISQRVDFYLPSQITAETARAVSIAAAIEVCYRKNFGGRSERRAQLVGGFPKVFVAMLNEHGMPWFLPAERPADGVPRIAWVRDASIEADAFAAEFLEAVTL